MDNLKIEKMNLQDLDTIKAILNSDFDDFWNYNVLKDELKNENSTYLVAKINSDVVGFAGIKVILDEADIMNIVVKKDCRNRGIGNSLLQNIIKLSYDLQLSVLTLEVAENNSPAIHLYEKFGFKKIGTRKNYYSSENDAILMKHELT